MLENNMDSVVVRSSIYMGFISLICLLCCSHPLHSFRYHCLCDLAVTKRDMQNLPLLIMNLPICPLAMFILA